MPARMTITTVWITPLRVCLYAYNPYDITAQVAWNQPRRSGYYGRVSTLYVVATPIGNLGDITLRAIDTLRACHTIACEDTRRTAKLLSHLEIHKPLLSCRGHNEEQAAGRIVALLEEDNDVAYATDAGTPGVSDPGNRLVAAVRRSGRAVVPIPGASAVTALLSVAPFGGRTVTFDGFLSPKSGRRRRRLEDLLARNEAFLLYESPHRVAQLLSDLATLAPERTIVVGREMTKQFEEYPSGSPEHVLKSLEARGAVKGEFALLVSGKDGAPDRE